MVTHCTNRVFVVGHMVTSCTNVRFVVSKRCDFFLILFERWFEKLTDFLFWIHSFTAKKTDLPARQNNIHEHAMVVWLWKNLRYVPSLRH